MATPTERLARRLFHAAGYESHHVPTSTGRVHHLTRTGGGALPPIVCVHGFAASSVQMAPLVRLLRPATRQITLVDLPGHGFSDVPASGFDTDALLRGILEALDRIISADAPAVLLGNSMGGYVAVRFALEKPHKVAKLVLVSPGGAQMDQATLDEMRKPFHVRSHADALRFVDALLGQRNALTRQIFALSVRRRLSREDLLGVLDAIRVDQLLDPADVARLSVATLCVWGQGDRILPRANLEFFRTHLPRGSRIVEPAGLGHSPYLEAPAMLAKLVLEFAGEPTPARAEAERLATA